MGERGKGEGECKCWVQNDERDIVGSGGKGI